MGEVTSRHPWRHSFQTLGFAFIIIGAILTMIGFVALNTRIYCPAGGCVYDLPESLILGSLLPSGLAPAIAGIVGLWMVRMESEREDRESP